MENSTVRRIRFGSFEADPSSGELRNDGRLIRLQEKPFQLLLALVNRAGDIVTREELRERLWPGESFGDFDQGLNTAINKVREALGDSAAIPNFIETVPKRGYQFIHAVAQETPGGPGHDRVQTNATRYAILAVLLLLGVVFAARLRTGTAPAPTQVPLRRFTIASSVPVAGTVLDPVTAAAPNGKHIAFITDEPRPRLAIHDLDTDSTRIIEGTDGARGPFRSPDSEFVAFSTAGQLRKMPARGGSATVICGECARSSWGGSWSPDGRSIVFSDGSPANLYEVPAVGGTRHLLLSGADVRLRNGLAEDPKVAGYLFHPQFLPQAPGRRVILFSVGYASATTVIRDLATGNQEVLGPGLDPVYSPSGHVLYRWGAGRPDIWAQPFSLETLKPAGEPFRIAQGGSEPSVAADGTLVYADSASANLVWRNREGVQVGQIGQAAEGVFYPALSPNGRFVAVEAMENGNADIWVHDLARGAKTRLTKDAATDIVPVWSPTGDEIAFSSYRAGNIDVFIGRADGAAPEKAIIAGPLNERVSDWSHDGRFIVYSVLNSKSDYDIWYAVRIQSGTWEPRPFLQTLSSELDPKLSPDGRYIAYVSDETGQFEVYVRPFPNGSRKWPISTRGGTEPRWRPDGRELFYTEGPVLIAVAVDTATDFRTGRTSRLFSDTLFRLSCEANYDVAQHGDRFVVPVNSGGSERKIHVVQNWFAEFRK